MIKDQKFSPTRRRKSLGMAGVVFFGAAVLSATGWAQGTSRIADAHAEGATSNPAAHARYYGDGLRQYAEGRFSEAARNLLRAYALDPQARTMALVVRAYDEMGFCDAVSRQREVYQSMHPEAPAPAAARCSRAGQVTVECVGIGGPILDERVSVDGRFKVECGREISLPPGDHQLSPGARRPEHRLASNAPGADSSRSVTVVAGQKTSVQIKFYDPPTRWKLAGMPAVDQLTDLAVRVERLEGQKLDYTVYLTEEGLYRVFIHSGARAIPAYDQVPFRPEVLRICDSGERFDARLRRCSPVEGLKIQKFD